MANCFVCSEGAYRISGCSDGPKTVCNPPDWANGQDCSGPPETLGAWCAGPQVFTTCVGQVTGAAVLARLQSDGYFGPWRADEMVAAFNAILCPGFVATINSRPDVRFLIGLAAVAVGAIWVNKNKRGI
jgi:hypothetical protein